MAKDNSTPGRQREFLFVIKGEQPAPRYTHSVGLITVDVQASGDVNPNRLEEIRQKLISELRHYGC